MRSGRNKVVRRLVAIVAAVLLASLAWAGPALAETPTPVAPIGALQDAASKSSPSSTAEEVPPATTEATTATKRSAAVAPNALAAPAIGGLGGIPGFPSTFPFPTSTAIPGLPPIAPGTDPATACSQVVSALRGLDPTQLSAALDSPAAIFCSALGFPLPSLPGLPGLPSSGGSFTETSFPEPKVLRRRERAPVLRILRLHPVGHRGPGLRHAGRLRSEGRREHRRRLVRAMTRNEVAGRTS